MAWLPQRAGWKNLTQIKDIRGCKELGLYGTICGKSIYKGTLDLKEAIALAEGV